MNLSIYSSRQEENIFIRRQAGIWQRSGLITNDQLAVISDLTDPDVRRTNIFFRLIFFIFTTLCANALLGLFIWITGLNSGMAIAAALTIAGSILYFLAEQLAAKYRFYRHGIEEALAVSSVFLLCLGLFVGITELFSGGKWSAHYKIVLCLLLAVNACWLYVRFGYLYAALMSITAACVIPFQLSLTPEGERIFLLFILGLIFSANVIFARRRNEDFAKARNTTLQACLLAAVYLTVNLEIIGLGGLLVADQGAFHLHPKFFSPYLYWSSYVLSFIIPAAGIFWGINNRRRFIMNVSLVMACLTLATNKSYLGWTRYAWDPVILGLVLLASSVFINRWLRNGGNNARNGFTAENILKAEDAGLGLAEAAAALTPAAAGLEGQQPPARQENYFEGGSSGGGGAAGSV